MASELPGTSVVVVGPKGCGKSTSLAHLCHLLGGFPEEEHTECRSLAKDLGRPAGQHVWMLDRTREEREHGSSVEPSLASFRSSSFAYTAMDTPGDAGHSKNMLSVTSLADVAVLVVPAVEGEFEVSVDNGRTRELALACFTMGIKNVVVWVTKMDDVSIKDPSARFEDIKKIVNNFLKEVGYKQKEVPFVPISGILGGNLVVKSSEMAWYAGKPAVDVLDSLGPMARPAEKPLRLPVLKVCQHDEAGAIVVGRVETGSVRVGVKVVFSPSGYVGEVKSIRKDGQQVSEAKGGDIVSVAFGDAVPTEELHRGMVLSSASNDPAAEAESFLAQVVVLDHPGRIRAGYCPAIAIHTAQIPCEFEELVSLIDRKTGKEAKANPESATSGEVLTVRMRPRVGICVEAFSAYPSLGRFAIRDHGRTIAVGVIKEVTKRSVPKARTAGGNEYFDN
mmetsp:Transcript_61743/g.174421  ORF Transcript_61743/g.174421 Transcript_61743/m.174421 type:complete len:449 (+) Transcript_61743:127-1473(+)